MMIALFQANPQAFSDNINLLRAGSVLRIPAWAELQRQAPETASAEVARQTGEWRMAYEQRTRLAHETEQRRYGPVGRGETLSDIAKQVERDGVTMQQMMIAVFEANPQAFAHNINLLYAGSVLSIPATAALQRQAPETAAAEVARQTNAWRTGDSRQARSNMTYAAMTASTRESNATTIQPLP
jgi:FimV-like protein